MVITAKQVVVISLRLNLGLLPAALQLASRPVNCEHRSRLSQLNGSFRVGRKRRDCWRPRWPRLVASSSSQPPHYVCGGGGSSSFLRLPMISAQIAGGSLFFQHRQDFAQSETISLPAGDSRGKTFTIVNLLRLNKYCLRVVEGCWKEVGSVE